MGRCPSHRKAQGSLFEEEWLKRHGHLDGLWVPGQEQRDAAQLGKCKQHPSRAPLSSLCPSVGSSPVLRVVSSQGTKACRGFIQHSLPSTHSTRLRPRWDQGGLSGTWGQGSRGKRLQGGGCSSEHTPPTSLFLTHVKSEMPAQSHQCQTGLSYWLEKSSTCLSQQPVAGNLRGKQWALQ